MDSQSMINIWINKEYYINANLVCLDLLLGESWFITKEWWVHYNWWYNFRTLLSNWPLGMNRIKVAIIVTNENKKDGSFFFPLKTLIFILWGESWKFSVGLICNFHTSHRPFFILFYEPLRLTKLMKIS